MRPISPQSFWHATADTPVEYPPLAGDVHADVAIIGAGITGLTAATHLKRAGQKVVVLEAGRVGSGTTGGTSAHLDMLTDSELREVVRDFGESQTRTCVDALREAIDLIESWSREFAIDCDFRRIPVFYYTEDPERYQSLHEECETACRLGLQAEIEVPVPLPFPNLGGFRVEQQARFHPLHYVRGLARQFHGGDCAIYEGTRAEPPKNGDPCTIQTNGGTVRARDVVLATHSPFLGISELDTRVAPYQSYVIGVRLRDSFPDALYWDDDDPYHYTRRASSTDEHLWIIGGADHKTGQTEDTRSHFADLEEYARGRFDVEAVEFKWSAEFFEPSDGLPYIGRVPFHDHLYVGTGYSGSGLSFGTVAGTVIAELILGGKPPVADVLTPSRIKPVASAGEFISQNLNVAKHFVKDRFTGEKIESLEAIARGEGRLVTYQRKQLAVFRDEQGVLHMLSPVCTHAGCIVNWNSAEQTWDCPCHGGRYAANGERIYGPPPHDLAREDVGP